MLDEFKFNTSLIVRSPAVHQVSPVFLYWLQALRMMANESEDTGPLILLVS